MAVSFGPVPAEVYEQNMGRWSRRLGVPFIDFMGQCNPTEILDVGCGTGSLTFMLANHFTSANIIGADISEELLEHARSLRGEHLSVRFVKADASVLPFADRSFDLTVASLVLNFVPAPKETLREMVRVTRPRGLIASTPWDLRGGLPHVRVVLDTAAAVEESASDYRTRFYSAPGIRPGELVSLFEAAGINKVEETFLTIRIEFRCFDDFWNPTAQSGLFGLYFRGLPQARQTLIRDKVRQAFLLGDEDGHRSFAATAWAVKGLAGSL